MRSSWKSINLPKVQVTSIKNRKIFSSGLRGEIQQVLMLSRLRQLDSSTVWTEDLLNNLLDVYCGLRTSDGVKIWQRSQYLYFEDLEKRFRVSIYNGKELISILVNELRHGGRCGEFVRTKGKKFSVVKEISVKNKKKK